MLDLVGLNTDGVLLVENICTQDELICLARSMGKVRAHPNGEDIATLRSSDGTNSRAGTFSNVYGLSTFPFHTDTAFWGRPARYVVMGMFNISQCTTNLILLRDICEHTSKDFLSKAQRAIYLVETFEGRKYTTPVFGKNGSYGIRFDPNTMSPANSYALSFHEEFLAAINKVEPTKIEWNGNKAVVFDNWHSLHNRSKVIKNEKREIFRIYLES